MWPLYQYDDQALSPWPLNQAISASASLAPPISASTSTTVVPPVYEDDTSTFCPFLVGMKLKLCIVHVPGSERGILKLVSSSPLSRFRNHIRPWLSSGSTQRAAPPPPDSSPKATTSPSQLNEAEWNRSMFSGLMFGLSYRHENSGLAGSEMSQSCPSVRHAAAARPSSTKTLMSWQALNVKPRYVPHSVSGSRL